MKPRPKARPSLPTRPCPPPNARVPGCGRGTLYFRRLGGAALLGICDKCGKTVGLA